MAAGIGIDRHQIHKMIWEARNRRGLVTIYQKQLAVHLGLSAPHMSRIIKELTEQGRITKIGARYRNVGIYSVKDPTEFEDVELRRTGLSPAN